MRDIDDGRTRATRGLFTERATLLSALHHRARSAARRMQFRARRDGFAGQVMPPAPGAPDGSLLLTFGPAAMAGRDTMGWHRRPVPRVSGGA